MCAATYIKISVSKSKIRVLSKKHYNLKFTILKYSMDDVDHHKKVLQETIMVVSMFQLLY